jgi:polar amino acid transport system permease protein
VLDLLPRLLEGCKVTLEVTFLAAGGAFFLALLAGLARLSRWLPVRFIATVYVEVFRGSSALVQIFYFFFVLPLIGIKLSPLLTGVLALSLNFGAYGSEVVRGAIRAVDRSQHEAALALHMPTYQSMKHVILPQAMVAAVPPFGNLLIELLKATSLVSVITLTDLAFAGRQLLQTTGRAIDIYIFVLLLYFAMAYPLTLLVRRLEARLSRGLHLVRMTQ